MTAHALVYAKGVNSRYDELLGSEIVFSPGAAYPHITLLMGHLREEDGLGALERVVSGFASSVLLDELLLTAPYRPATDSRYVFIGVAHEEPIVQLKMSMARLTDDLLIPDTRSKVDTTPHITVAYIRNCADTLLCPVPISIPDPWTPKGIAIAKTQAHGTCVEVLKKFKFGG